MTAISRPQLWLVLGVHVAIAMACTSKGGAPSEPSTTAVPMTEAAVAAIKPAPEEPEALLSAELKHLKRAIDSQDSVALHSLLSPSGVMCGDYLYGQTEYEMLVHRPDGGLRSWVFGSGQGKTRSLRTYLKFGTLMVKSQSANHRSAEFSYEGGSLYIWFTLTNGRWLVSEGLFCE